MYLYLLLKPATVSAEVRCSKEEGTRNMQSGLTGREKEALPFSRQFYSSTTFY